MLPVHRLPPEILTHILNYVPSPAVTRSEVTWTANISCLSDIVTLTAVCGHRRDIINTRQVYGAVSLVARTRNLCGADDTFRYVSSWVNASGLQACKTSTSYSRDAGHRIQELHIQGQEMHPRLPFPFLSSLEHLVQPDALVFLSVTGLSTWPTFLHSSVPRLRCLTLRGLRTCHKVPIGSFPSLVQLSLRNIYHIAFEDVAKMLTRARKLEDLHIHDCFARSAQLPWDVEIPLDRSLEPHLKRVSIIDMPDAIERIISYITLDEDAAVSTCSYTPSRGTMAMILQSSCAKPPTKLALIHLDQSLMITGTNSASSMCHKWKLFFDKGNVLPPFSFLLPLAPIQELWVLGYTDFFMNSQFPVRNRDCIEGLPETVETIWIDSAYVQYIVAALDGAQNVTPVRCTNLSTLNILVHHQRGLLWDPVVYLQDDLSSLIDCASRRADAGCAIQRVVIHFVNTARGRPPVLYGISRLTQVVGTVEYVVHSGCPRMDLPSVCTTADGDWWPTWTAEWKRNFKLGT